VLSVPALLAILGAALYFPRRLRVGRTSAGADPPASGRLVRVVTDRRSAAVATAAGVVLLAVLAAPVLALRLDVSFTSGLPSSDPLQQGARVLTRRASAGSSGRPRCWWRAPAPTSGKP
jgi:RND superfamily putative drug exporter